jgi:signal transduction histidine kinase
MRLWHKLSIPIVIVTLTVTLVAAFVITASLKQAFFKEDYEKTKSLVLKSVNTYLRAEYFSRPNDPDAQEHFRMFSEVIRDTNAARFTIWSKDHTVLFSDLTPIIGYHSPDHVDLKRLFEDRAAFFIEKSTDNNKPVQSKVGDFLDTYIPVAFDGEILGAVEIQRVNAVIIKPIEKEMQNIIYLLLFGGLITLATTFFVIRRIITRPLGFLGKAAQLVVQKEFDYPIAISSHDEIGELSTNFVHMRTLLKSLVQNLEAEVELRTEELGEEKARLLASINSISFGFIIADLDHQIFLKNKAAQELFELPAEGQCSIDQISDLLGKEFDLRGRIEECINGNGMACEMKEVLFGARFLRGIIAPVIAKEDARKIIGYVILFEDITEAKVLERSRDEFFSIASHELRTPLTAIRGNSEMLQEISKAKNLDTDTTEMLNDIHAASVQLIQIVGDFIDVARLEQGNVKMEQTPFAIVEPIEQTLRTLKNSAEEKGLILAFTKDEHVPPVIGDKGRVVQVLTNIIGNAIKFTPAGTITIEVLPELEKRQVKVLVSDTGIGISPEQQTLLFHKFQQAGENILARDVTQGTGLGLYISKLLMERMGGTIGLTKSVPGEGSTFYFTVPLA